MVTFATSNIPSLSALFDNDAFQRKSSSKHLAIEFFESIELKKTFTHSWVKAAPVSGLWLWSFKDNGHAVVIDVLGRIEGRPIDTNDNEICDKRYIPYSVG